MFPSDFLQAFPIFLSSPLLSPSVGRPWCRRFRKWQCSVDCSLARLLPAPRFVLFFVRVPPLGWLGVFIIVLFFVCVPPLGWLGAMIIVSFFVCVPPLGWLGDIIIVFIIVMERVRFSVWCGCV